MNKSTEEDGKNLIMEEIKEFYFSNATLSLTKMTKNNLNRQNPIF
jgi:hypothetical protein